MLAQSAGRAHIVRLLVKVYVPVEIALQVTLQSVHCHRKVGSHTCASTSSGKKMGSQVGVRAEVFFEHLLDLWVPARSAHDFFIVFNGMEKVYQLIGETIHGADFVEMTDPEPVIAGSAILIVFEVVQIP